METPIEIMFDQMDPSPGLRARVRMHAEALERFAARIERCRVVIARRQGDDQGDRFSVHITVDLPGSDTCPMSIRSKDETHPNVQAALRQAFDSVVRLLEDHMPVWSNEIPRHKAPSLGRVVRLFKDEGFGFVETSEGEIYFSHDNVADDAFDRLEVGDQVRLVAMDRSSEDGRQAATLYPVDRHRPVCGHHRTG